MDESDQSFSGFTPRRRAVPSSDPTLTAPSRIPRPASSASDTRPQDSPDIVSHQPLPNPFATPDPTTQSGAPRATTAEPTPRQAATQGPPTQDLTSVLGLLAQTLQANLAAPPAASSSPNKRNNARDPDPFDGSDPNKLWIFFA